MPESRTDEMDILRHSIFSTLSGNDDTKQKTKSLDSGMRRNDGKKPLLRNRNLPTLPE